MRFYKTRAVRRLMPEKEINKEMILRTQGVPWSLTESAVVKPKQNRRTDTVDVAVGRG